MTGTIIESITWTKQNLDHLHSSCVSRYTDCSRHTVRPSLENRQELELTRHRGIVRTLASICFSSSVGRWVDRSPKRLTTLIDTISVNRITVIAACVAWYFVVQHKEEDAVDGTSLPPGRAASISPVLKHALFAVILILGIGENLSASGNMISVCNF